MRNSNTVLLIVLCFTLALGCGDDGPDGGVGNEDEEVRAEAPRLMRLEFLADDNPALLISDASCTITGDSAAECWVPHLMSGKRLVARFAVDGGGAELLADGVRVESGATAVDFSRPVRLTVSAGGLRRTYTVSVHAFTGLPVMWIETDGRQPITSKDEYTAARFRLTEDVATRSAGDITEGTLQIRGRGNSTWYLLEKKPYRLRLDEKLPLLGMPASRHWVLLANHADKTMLRNSLALRMGAMSSMEWTPRAHFVELMLNGRYDGTYLLAEKVRVARSRVDVGDDGFLIEVDGKAGEEEGAVTLRVPHIAEAVSIEEPATAAGAEAYEYISRFLSAADSVLFSDGFADPASGWRRYMDEDTFADWYVVNEVARNNDAAFYSSCYMSLRRGGKLKMGPLWDFDIAFGNVSYNGNYAVEGLWVGRVAWFARLMQDPAFAARVKERLEYFRSRRDELLAAINADARYLRRSVEENDSRWGVLYDRTWPNYDIWGRYENEVQHLKQWLTERMEWLRDNL